MRAAPDALTAHPFMRRHAAALAAAACLCLGAAGAAAQESNEDQPPDEDTGESTLTERTLGLLPQPFKDRGVKFAATYIGEALGNFAGGLRTGAVVQGRLNLAVDVDFARLAGWRGLTGHANIFAIHGDGLTRNEVLNLLGTSGIEALPAVRLYEAYLEQKFWNDTWSLRFGQFAADAEFLATKYTDVFTSATFGWPAIAAVNLPSGGPAPPLAALGVRLYGQLTGNLSWLTAVFDGDPAGPGAGDPQQRNRDGLNFRVNDPPLVISELQLAWASACGVTHRPGTLKLGGWYHFGSFADERFDDGGLSLADPASSGIARQLRGNDGVYLVAEQRLASVPGAADRGVGVFLRTSASPGDRNLISSYTDAGIDFLGLADARPHDKFGIAFGYARIAPRAQALDRDFAALNGAAWPQRRSEALLTLAYSYEATAGWNLVPNVQFIKRPGGGAADPLGPSAGRPLRDAVVAGVRTVVKF